MTAAIPMKVTPCECGDHCFTNVGFGLNMLFSEEDAHLLRWRWRGQRLERNYILLSRMKTIGPNKRTRVVFAREVMNAPKGLQVDHINLDSLDNRRSNLRICSAAENSRNRRANSRSTTGVKGVHPHRNKFVAAIKADGRTHYLGIYETIEEAKVAYQKAAVVLHGDFARTE